ncbi:hypothetical protein IWQ60_007524 [Tieghemiomyces parasiticus]|uniref:Myb-like domain-containing protein n=1 Tax=Tieghemiomyces parasiticus TaxID=78921 RepID=A0A9W8A1Y3_9FUNG|nr:hypothetical protein IWQ60_007524 [Tieghemiomyces parasiticus]
MTRLRRTWTKADNDKLLEAVKRLGEDNWPAVEKLFPEFSPGSVYAHYNALTRTTRNPIWKPFETARLRKAIDQYGGPNCMDQWINIARAVGRGRTAEDCYSQWYRRPFDPYPNAWGPPQLDVALLLIIYDASPRLLIRAPVLLDLCQAFREAYPVSYYSSTEDVAYIQCWQLHVGESGSLADMTAEGEVEVAAKEVNVKDKPDIRIWHQVALKRHAEWTKMAGTSSPNASTLAVEKKPEFSPLSPPPSFIHPSHIRNRFMRLMMGSNLAARFTPANLDLFRAGWMTPEKVSPAMAKQVMGVEATEFELRSLAWYLRCIGRFLPMIEDAQHGAYSNSLAVVSTLHRPALVA